MLNKTSPFIHKDFTAIGMVLFQGEQPAYFISDCH